jgi:hypothetical protein
VAFHAPRGAAPAHPSRAVEHERFPPSGGQLARAGEAGDACPHHQDGTVDGSGHGAILDADPDSGHRDAAEIVRELL